MLLAHVLARADARNTPCFLITQDNKNVRYYQKFGFEILEEVCFANLHFTHVSYTYPCTYMHRTHMQTEALFT